MDNQIATKIEESVQLENTIVKPQSTEKKPAINEPEIPYQTILEEMPQSVAIISDEGQILYANVKLAELIGIPLEKLMSSNFTRLLEDEQVEAFKQLLKDQQQERFAKEIKYRRADNKILTLRLSISRLPANSFGQQCIIIIDLTEIRKAELELKQTAKSLEEKKAELVINKEQLLAAKKNTEKLLESELSSKISTEKAEKELLNEIETRVNTEVKLKRSLELIDQIIAKSLDSIKLLNEEGNILQMSEGGQKIMEIENLSTYLNNPWLNFWKGAEKEKALNALTLAQNGGIGKFEGFRATEKGNPKWWEVVISPIRDENGKIYRLWVITRDITQRVKYEQALSKSESNLRAIFENSTEGFLLMDKEHTILEFNSAMEKIILEIENGHLQKNKNIISDLKKEKLTSFLDSFKAVMNGEKFNFEKSYPKLDGSSLWIEIKIYPIINLEQTIIGVCMAMTDISNRKKSELKTIQAKEFYENLIDNSNAPIIIWDPKLNITRFNHAFEMITGVTESEMIGKPIHLVFPLSKNQKPIEQISQRLNENHNESIEVEITHIDKSIKTLLWTTSHLFDTDGKTILSTIGQGLDITERKKGEAELLESEKRLKLSLETNQMGVWELFVDDGNIIRTPTHDKIFGYDTLLPKFNLEIFKDHILPADRSWVTKMIKDAIETKSEYKFETRIRRADGAIRWIYARGTPKLDTEGKLKSILGVVQDISERKLNDEALAKTENNLRSLFENTLTGYLLMDNNFTIVEFNNLMAKYFTIADNKILKKNENVLNNLINERQESFSKLLKAVLNGEKLNYEISYSLPDGNPLWLDTRIYPVTNTEGKAIGVCMSYEDVTKRKLDEQKIQELNKTLDKKVLERTAQYESLNKELEAFTFSVSHDLRAPLRAVNSYAQILEDEQKDKLTEDGQLMLKNIKNNGQKMGRLIDDLLAFSRLGRQEIKKIQVNMNELTTTAIEELNRILPNHAAIQLIPLPEVEGDYTLLYQVMLNLIGNAIKYSSKKEKPVITIYTEQKEGKTIFIVKDNGAGFDMRFADKLFGVFQRLHSEQEFEGNGVGLAIVQRIISKHGGKIWGEGKENEGASFYFTLN